MARSDEIIKKEIVDEFYWDSSIDASKIEIMVDNGVATLSGEVPTYGDLSIARSLPWRIAGVTDIIDNLAVSYDMPTPIPPDDEILNRVQNILTWNPTIDETKIIVSVNEGLVTLEGTVDAYWKKALSEDKISGLTGIVDIENKLAVVPTEKIDDELIAEDIVSAYDRDIQVDPEDITVRVEDGIVALSGSVPYPLSRLAAERDAVFTTGVIDVDNLITVAV